MEVGSLASQLVAIAGADEVSLRLRLVLPADYHAPGVQGLHARIDVEHVRPGEAIRRRRVGANGEAVPYSRQQLISAYPGKRVLLRVEQDVDKHAVLRRMLRREIGGYVKTPGEARECPRVDVGRGHNPYGV